MRLGRFKRIFLLMCVVGVAFAAFYCGKVFFSEYASAQAHITLTYPEIASSTYPDGERFTAYSLIEDEKLQEALNRLQAEGKYENYTVEDVKEKLFLYSYLKESAGQSVSEARSAGNDYTYVANEYRLTYIQPHDYRNPSLSQKLFSPDYSMEFLETLVEINREQIAQYAGGPEGFLTLTELGDLQGLDYEEEVQQVRTHVNSIVEYLNDLEEQSPGFVSSEENISVKDLVGDFRLLNTDMLDGLANYIESSNISRDVEIATNRLQVNLENNTLEYEKQSDRSVVNKYAIDNYDHTFTENLINVVLDENNALYQARPKTAFDTVVEQKHDADEQSAAYIAEITTINQDLTDYGKVSQNSAAYQRLCENCDAYLEQLHEEYQALTQKASAVVQEYYEEANEDYLRCEVVERDLLDKDLFLRAGVFFCVGALLTFIVCMVFSILQDKVMLRQKRKLLAHIKQAKIGRI